MTNKYEATISEVYQSEDKLSIHLFYEINNIDEGNEGDDFLSIYKPYFLSSINGGLTWKANDQINFSWEDSRLKLTVTVNDILNSHNKTEYEGIVGMKVFFNIAGSNIDGIAKEINFQTFLINIEKSEFSIIENLQGLHKNSIKIHNVYRDRFDKMIYIEVDKSVKDLRFYWRDREEEYTEGVSDIDYKLMDTVKVIDGNENNGNDFYEMEYTDLHGKSLLCVGEHFFAESDDFSLTPFLFPENLFGVCLYRGQYIKRTRMFSGAAKFGFIDFPNLMSHYPSVYITENMPVSFYGGNYNRIDKSWFKFYGLTNKKDSLFFAFWNGSKAFNRGIIGKKINRNISETFGNPLFCVSLREIINGTEIVGFDYEFNQTEINIK